MWKTILSNINSVLLKNWALLVWFVIGLLVGTFFLPGCSSVEKEVKEVSEVVDTK